MSRCKHLQKKIIVNWLVNWYGILRQQSFPFIDYIYLNKSKSYVGDMQAKLKERKMILENFAALIAWPKRDNQSKSATNQPKIKVKMLCCICTYNFKKHSDKSIAQATVFQSLTVAISSKGLVFAVTAEKKLNKWMHVI